MDHRYKRSTSNPGAVVNTDKDALAAYKQKKAQMQKINNLEKRLDTIEDLMKQILQKMSKED